MSDSVLRKGCIDLKMKKILSGIVAVMLAVTLSAPVLAADATPGEQAEAVTGDISVDSHEGNIDAATAQMKEMTQLLQDPSATISGKMNDAALQYFDALEAAGKPGDTFSHAGSFADENGAWWKVRYEVGSNFASGTDFMTYTDNGSSITISATPHGTPSSTGYAVTIVLPRGNTASRYTVKMLGDNAQANDSLLTVKGYLDDNDNMVRYVSFWIPYLATYQLSEFTLSSGDEGGKEEAEAEAEAVEVLESIKEDWSANPEKQQEAENSMEAIVEALDNSDVEITNTMSAAGVSYFDKLVTSNMTDKISKQEFNDGENVLTVSSANTGDNTTVNVKLNSLTMDGDVITLDMDHADGDKSGTGYYITIDLPEGNTAKVYNVTMVGENAQRMSVLATVKNGTVSFWVPHFTVYQLTPINVDIPDQPTGDGDTTTGGNTSTGSGSTSVGNNSTTSSNSGANTNQVVASGNSNNSSNSAAVVENPIKKTGVEMSFALFAIAAAAVIAVGGIRVAVSKARKGE